MDQIVSTFSSLTHFKKQAKFRFKYQEQVTVADRENEWKKNKMKQETKRENLNKMKR